MARWATALILALCAAPVAAVGARGLGAGSALTAAVFVAAAVATYLLTRHRAPALDFAGARASTLTILWLLVAIAAVGELYRLSVFMDDPAGRFRPAFYPSDYYAPYSSLAACAHATDLAREGAPNIYDIDLYQGWKEPLAIAPFLLSPPSLLPVRAGQLASRDFLDLRRLWFAAEAVLLLIAVLALVNWIEPTVAHRLFWLFPILLLAPPMVLTHQVGNYQVHAILLALVAMVWIERGYAAAGGAALAFATLAKIFPGILIVWLAAKRQWRALAWTAAFGVLCAAVTASLWGLAPFRAFIGYTMPRLATGEAFPDFEVTASINLSVFGFVQKLQALGLQSMTRRMGAQLSWAYSVWVVGFVLLVALRSRPRTRAGEAARWLAVVNLASLRSPFLPDIYGLYGSVALVGLLAADRAECARHWVWAAALLIALSIVQGPWVPALGIPLPVVYLAALGQQLLVLGVNLAALIDPRIQSSPGL